MQALQIVVSKGVALMSVRPRDGRDEEWARDQAECLRKLAHRNIAIEMLAFQPLSMRFIIDESFVTPAAGAIADSALWWSHIPRCARVRVAGENIDTESGIFYRALTVLLASSIPVLHFSDSDVAMSLLVSQRHATHVEALLCGIFNEPADDDFWACGGLERLGRFEQFTLGH